MTIDVIIISDAKNPQLRSITDRGIYSAIANETKAKVNIIVVEGNRNIKYQNATMVYQEGHFGYNKFLNFGASFGTSEYIAFCNNDLIFGKDWASKLIHEMQVNNIDSVSPYSANSQLHHKSGISKNTGIFYGHEIKKHFEGWCFVWKRELWNEIKLDERILFWASDNATAEQLKAAGKTHALVTHAIVDHPDNGGKTLKTVPEKRRELTTLECQKFNRLYNKNIENAGTGE